MLFSGVSGALLPLALLSVGVIYAAVLRLFPLRHPVRTVRRMMGEDRGDALRALSMALAGTLGVGNIAGVALAIALGGAGSVLWMWVSALVAAFLKYAEILLAFLYRDGGRGGAMYYMRDGIGGRLGRLLAVLFSVLCLASAFTLGGAVQANAVAESLSLYSVPPLFSGTLLVAFCALVVFGGAKRISRLTSYLIPLLTALYLFLSLFAIFRCIDRLPEVFRLILSDAFTPKAPAAGVGAFLSVRCIRYGVTRGLVSNEAGAGTAPLAHVTAKNGGVSQGILGMAEVFIDTVVLCSLTAFVLLLHTPSPDASRGGITLVLDAFCALVGDWTRAPLILSVVLFVYATVIAWCYYGESALAYLTKSKRARRVYLCLFLVVLFLGSIGADGTLWELTDLSLSAMTLLNLFALLFLLSEVKKETSKELFTNKRE